MSPTGRSTPTRTPARSPALLRCEAAARTTRGSGRPTGPIFWASCPAPAAVFVRTAEGLYRPACVDPGAFFKANESGARRSASKGLDGDTAPHFRGRTATGSSATRQSQFSAIVLDQPRGGLGAARRRGRARARPKARGPCARPRRRAADRRDSRGRRRGNNENARRDDRLQAQPAAAQAIHLPPPGQKLVGFLIARGDETEPYTVRLQPWGRSPAAWSTPKASRGQVSIYEQRLADGRD